MCCFHLPYTNCTSCRDILMLHMLDLHVHEYDMLQQPKSEKMRLHAQPFLMVATFTMISISLDASKIIIWSRVVG